MIINHRQFQEAVAVLKLLPLRQGMGSSQFIRVRQVDRFKTEWTLTSGATAIAHVEGEGTWPSPHPLFLDRTIIEPFLARTKPKTEPYEFNRDGDEVHIQCGRHHVIVPTVRRLEHYEDCNPIQGVEISNNHAKVLGVVASFATPDPSMPWWNPVHITKEGMAMAADRLTLCGAQIDYTGQPLFLPIFTTKLSSKARRIVVSGKTAMLEFNRAAIYETIWSFYRTFPASQIGDRLLETSDAPLVFTSRSSSLLQALKEIQYIPNTQKKHRTKLTVTCGDGVSLNTSAFGSTEIDVPDVIPARHISFDVTFDQLQSALNHVSPIADTVECRYREGGGFVRLDCLKGGELKATVVIGTIGDKERKKKKRRKKPRVT